MRDLTITDVRVHPGDSAFLADDGQTAILYDTGFAFTGYGVADNIARVLGERKLDWIFLTHSHYDHALGSAYVRRRWPDVKIAAGSYAAKIFQKPTARAVMRELDRKCALENGIAEYEDLIDELHVDLALEDGDVIEAGDLRFTAVALPGHTRCSMGFYEASRKLLLSCETPGVFDGESVVVPSYLVGYQMALDSIARVEEMDIEQILIPHLGLLNREQTAVYLKLARKSAVETAQELADILKNGGTHAEAVEHLRRKFYHGRIREAYPPAAFELNAGIKVKLIEKELVE